MYGSCHIAYPPQMLDAHSWLHMMNGLANHFGTDASPRRASRRAAIADFLAQELGRPQDGPSPWMPRGNPLLRITETALL
jgi:hypothetical protein